MSDGTPCGSERNGTPEDPVSVGPIFSVERTRRFVGG